MSGSRRSAKGLAKEYACGRSGGGLFDQAGLKSCLQQELPTFYHVQHRLGAGLHAKGLRDVGYVASRSCAMHLEHIQALV